MNTEITPFAKRRKAAIRRPFLLTALFLLLLFGSYFAILLIRPGSPVGRGDGADGSGSGPLSGDGSGAGVRGSGHGGTGAQGNSGAGSSDTAKNKNMGAGQQKPTASPAPVSPAAPSSGKEEKAPPVQSSLPNPAKHASPLAVPQEKFAAIRSFEEAAYPDDNNLSGSGGKEGQAGGTGGYGSYANKGFFGIQVQGNTVFLVDVSSSMGATSLEGSRIELLKLQLKKAVHGTSSGNYAIIAFSTGTTTFPRSGKPRAFSKGYDKEVKQFVDSLQAAGGTNLLAALQKLKRMTDGEIKVKTVFLLTDGEPSSPWSTIMAYIEKEIPEKIIFHTISIGQDCPEMEALAKKRKGRYKSVR